MKILRFILRVLINVYGSADPNLLLEGIASSFINAKKRRESKEKLSDQFQNRVTDIDNEISDVKSRNPFDSAAAKSAMTKASRNAKQMQKRLFNTMGANASAESMVGAQGETTKAFGAAAGQIATGAEAMKKQELSQLRGLKAGYESQASGLEQAAINERGSGWRDAFSFMNPISGAIQGGAAAAE